MRKSKVASKKVKKIEKQIKGKTIIVYLIKRKTIIDNE